MRCGAHMEHSPLDCHIPEISGSTPIGCIDAWHLEYFMLGVLVILADAKLVLGYFLKTFWSHAWQHYCLHYSYEQLL